MNLLASFAPYYYFVYWLLVMSLTVNYFNLLNRSHGYVVINRKYDYKSLVIFSIFFILFFGLRPLVYGNGIFGDTMNYHRTYTVLQDYGILNISSNSEVSKDPLFYFLMY